MYSGVVAKKNPAAVALGRRGGLKGGPARAAKLTKEQLSESGRRAVQARWAKQKQTKGAAGQTTPPRPDPAKREKGVVAPGGGRARIGT
jgi:hypothetical protein